MSRDAFVSIVQAWLRSRGLDVSGAEGRLDDACERVVLTELTYVLDDAHIHSGTTRTREIAPETLAAAIAASR